MLANGLGGASGADPVPGRPETVVRVIIVSPVLPLAFGNTDARWLHVITAELARRNVDVTCISSTEEPPEAVDDALRSAERHGFQLTVVPLSLSEGVVRRKLASLRRPFSERDRCMALRVALEREVERGYDIVHIEHLFNGWLALRLPRSVVYIHHLEVADWGGGTDLTLRERQVLFQMSRATRHLLKHTSLAIVATRRLAREIQRFRRLPVPVVPIGIDTQLYTMPVFTPSPTVGLIGSMHWSPSLQAAHRLLDLWPGIHERIPEARLLIAGRNSEQYLADRFPAANATLIGQVSDPSDFFSQICVMVYPARRGTGVKVKVLEAFAYGVPVVSNHEGFEGLAVGPNTAVIAQSDREFITQTVAILKNAPERERIRLAARRLVEQEHSPSPTVDRLMDAYEQLGLRGRHGHGGVLAAGRQQTA